MVAAAAIDLVRQLKLWALADDVEHVLAFRDARDWYVFEAASWALAERRMPAERRRELWLEPLPAAELAGRLRGLPLFASVSVDELFRIAGASRQVRHQPGTTLLLDGIVPETIHILLDGRVTAHAPGTSGDGAPYTIESPATLGFVQSLQGRPMRRSMRTTENAVTLALTADELRTLLADNTELVRGLFSTLAERVDASMVSNLQSTGAAVELEQLAAQGLLPVEKVLALQRVPVFSRISVEEMRPLADIAQTVSMTAGSPLFAESAPLALWIVLSGEVAMEDGDGRLLTARSGDIIGSLSMLTGQPAGRSAEVLRAGVALRIDRDDLFDLLGQRPELMRQLFEGMFAVGSETVTVQS